MAVSGRDLLEYRTDRNWASEYSVRTATRGRRRYALAGN